MKLARSVVGFVAIPSIEVGGQRPPPAISQSEELERQRARIRDYPRERRWRLRDIYEGTLAPGERWVSTIRISEGLRSAMDDVETGQATALVVDRPERLSFFTADIERMVAWLREQSSVLVAIDDGLDASRALGCPKPAIRYFGDRLRRVSQ